MANPFKKIVDGFKWLGRTVLGLKKYEPAFKKALDKVADLIEYALPAAKAVAAMTPPEFDDLKVAQAEYWAKKLREVGRDPDKVFIEGAKLVLSSEKIREQLLIAIKNSKNGIEVAGQVLRTVEDVLGLSDTTLRTAAQVGYSALKNAGEA